MKIHRSVVDVVDWMAIRADFRWPWPSMWPWSLGSEVTARGFDVFASSDSLTNGLIRRRITINNLTSPECQQKHVGVYARDCMHGMFLVASWPGSWPWRRGHINNNCGKVLHYDLACPNMASATGRDQWRRGLINNNCGKVLHDDLACPNMASATWLHTWITNYYWSHGAIRTHQSGAI
jgi:hypothetical protein